MVDLKEIKAVIFDQDGLMFNTEDIYRAAIVEMGARRGKLFTDEIHRRMMGRGVLEDVTILKDAWHLPDSPQALFDERRSLFLKDVEVMIRPETGLTQLIQTLTDRKIRLCIVTGSSRELTEQNLKRFDLTSAFEFVITGEEVKQGKPAPDFYLAAVERLGLSSHRCLAIEDSVNGILSAKSADCFAFAVPNKYNQNDDFSKADDRFQTLTEIAELFQKP